MKGRYDVQLCASAICHSAEDLCNTRAALLVLLLPTLQTRNYK